MVTPEGKIGTIYDDSVLTLADAIGGNVRVIRASTVSYDNERKGWTVRSVHDPELAIRAADWCRWGVAREGNLIAFKTRAEALNEEHKLFWELMEK